LLLLPETLMKPARHRIVLLLAASAGVVGLAASVLRSALDGGTLAEAFSDWVYPLLYLPPAFVCVLRAWSIRSERVAWGAFGLALLLWAMGWLYYGALVRPAAAPPYPSGADVLWLAFYPIVYVALISLARSRTPGFGRSVWLDGLIGALALGAVAAAFVVNPIIESSGDDLGAVLTSLAYPLGDLALLTIVMTVLAHSGWRPGGDWLLIALALLVQVVSDLVYVHQVAVGSWSSGTLLDASWLLGGLLVARAAWQRPARREIVDLDRWTVLLVPSLFTVVAVALLVYGNFDAGLSDVASILATAAIVVGLARGAVTFREKRRLRGAATKDPLTGLLNHGAFHARLDAEILRQSGSGGRFAVVVLDLDGFKQVNDRRGHPEGDRVLRMVADAIDSSCRSDDAAGRIGGDEFGLLLSDLDTNAATAVAERVSGEIAALGDVQVSYGVGEWPQDGPRKDTVLMRADVALYAAKTGAGDESPSSFSDPAQTRAGDPDRAGRLLRRTPPPSAEALARLQLEVYASDIRKSYARELRRAQQLHESYLATVRTLATAVEAKDDYTGGHIQRVHSLGLLLARAMVPEDAHDPQLSFGLLLHDIGKLSVPDAVLNKPGKLDSGEWELMRAHPEEGARILAAIPFLGRALDVVRHHHERWDGDGYPSGLRGEAIPLWARMFCLVDAVDAMTSDRPYRRALSLDEAVRELRSGSGTQFDPTCVRAFEALPRGDVRALLQRAEPVEQVAESRAGANRGAGVS
jgi:two-component system cell cycle response regulator